MGQWGKTDAAADMPIWIGQLNKKKANTANRTAAFGNSSPNVIGVFTVNTAEAQANPGIAHAGIITRKVGSGGRAGRVQTEVLIAAGSYGATDAADDTQIPDARVTIPSSTPANKTVATASATSLTISPTVKPTGVALTYQWELSTNGGGSFAALTNVGVYTGVTTSTLSISASTGLTGNQYRVIVTPVAGVAKTSRAAVLTVTP